MGFAFNTSLHWSIKSTPYFLTFGHELLNPNLQRYYGKSSSTMVPTTSTLLPNCSPAQHGRVGQVGAQLQQVCHATSFHAGAGVWLSKQKIFGPEQKTLAQLVGPLPNPESF